MSGFAKTVEPPYYAVIFTSQRTDADSAGYELAAKRMVALAQDQPGFLGVESVRGDDGRGITVSYWTSRESIHAWRSHVEHAAAQAQGRSDWYANYQLRICRVESAYTFGPCESPHVLSGRATQGNSTA